MLPDTPNSTLEGFEWQDGAPTAKIRTNISGTTSVVVDGTPTLYRVTGTRTTYFDWRFGRLIKMIDDYTIAQTDTGGNVTFGGGGSGSTGPGGFRTGSGGGGSSGSGGAGDIGALKVMAVTSLSSSG